MNLQNVACGAQYAPESIIWTEYLILKQLRDKIIGIITMTTIWSEHPALWQVGAWFNRSLHQKHGGIYVAHLSFICKCLFNMLVFFFLSLSLSDRGDVCVPNVVWVTADLS